MSDLDDIIDLTITVTDKAPEKPGFGIPMIVDYHTAWSDRVREYGRASELLDDGFTTASPVYQAAVAIKSQSPSPRTFKVGRLANQYTQTIHLIPTITTVGHVYAFSINGTPITYTVTSGNDIQAIVEALEPLVEAVTDVESTEDNAKVIAVSTAGLTLPYTMQRGINVLDVTANSGGGGIEADLAAIADEDNDWYGLITIPTSDAIVKAAAAWTEANSKLYIPQSADWDIIDAGESGDLASDLVALAYTRTAGIWHRHIGGSERADAAWLATQLTPDPGSYTAAFKTLAGVSVDDLRAGERTALTNKRWTRYARQGGINITFEGRTPSGRFVDVTRFVDWLYAEIQVDVYSLLVNNPKVPYTDAGIAAIKGAIAGSLKKGQEVGGLADFPAPVVTAPTVAETDTVDRANRILRNVEFTARLAGALHGIVINGTVSV
jgi:hypothetical protein